MPPSSLPPLDLLDWMESLRRAVVFLLLFFPQISVQTSQKAVCRRSMDRVYEQGPVFNPLTTFPHYSVESVTTLPSNRLRVGAETDVNISTFQ